MGVQSLTTVSQAVEGKLVSDGKWRKEAGEASTRKEKHCEMKPKKASEVRKEKWQPYCRRGKLI